MLGGFVSKGGFAAPKVGHASRVRAARFRKQRGNQGIRVCGTSHPPTPIENVGSEAKKFFVINKIMRKGEKPKPSEAIPKPSEPKTRLG
jgi:hypothetical protein